MNQTADGRRVSAHLLGLALAAFMGGWHLVWSTLIGGAIGAIWNGLHPERT